MASLKYTLHEGPYKFSTDLGVELHLKNTQLDKYGRIHADARFVTREGAVLGLAHGDLTSGQLKRDLAAQVAARNSGDPVRWENAVIEAVVALEVDPNVVSQELPLSNPYLISAHEYVSSMPPRR